MDPGRAEWAMPPPPPGPVKISTKKTATQGGHIDFMFLSPPLPGRWILLVGATPEKPESAPARCHFSSMVTALLECFNIR